MLEAEQQQNNLIWTITSLDTGREIIKISTLQHNLHQTPLASSVHPQAGNGDWQVADQQLLTALYCPDNSILKHANLTLSKRLSL